MITDYERSIAKRFVDLWSDQQGEKYLVLDGADPPDFLLNSAKRSTWLELTDIYMNETQGKFSNCPTETKFEFFGDPAETAERLVKQLNRKLANIHYQDVYEARGKGILLLTCQDCVFDSVNLARVDERLSSFTPDNDQRFFEIAYFEYCLNGNRFYGEVYPGRELPTCAITDHG